MQVKSVKNEVHVAINDHEAGKTIIKLSGKKERLTNMDKNINST